MRFESVNKIIEIEDYRSVEQREQDADTLAIMRESGFLKRISIDSEAVLKSLAEWQRTGDEKQLQTFFENNSEEEIVKEFGKNGIEAMNLILNKLRKIKELAKVNNGLKNKQLILDQLNNIKKAA